VKGRVQQSVLWVVSGVAFSALAAPSRAAASDVDLPACLAAYDTGQRQQQSGDLVHAADQMLRCGGPACPLSMQRDCQRWLDEIHESLPSVVFRALDANGGDVSDVRLSIDLEPARALDGRAIPLNPGRHVVHATSPGFEPLERELFAVEGDKLRRYELHLVPTGSARTMALMPEPASMPFAAEPTREGTRLLQSSTAKAALLGGAGVAVIGGAGFAFFGLHARSDERGLSTCTPHCSKAHVEHIKGEYVLSNVSLGIGLTGLAVTAAVVLIGMVDPPSNERAPVAAALDAEGSYWLVRF
jgi:hypothetical protein